MGIGVGISTLVEAGIAWRYGRLLSIGRALDEVSLKILPCLDGFAA
jgi:hypothetical protein